MVSITYFAGTERLQQVADVVCRGDHAAAARGGERGIAVARGDVEHPFVGLQVAGLGERLAEACKVVPITA